MHIFLRSVLKHDVDSCDNLGVADLAVSDGGHCKLTVFTSV